MKKFLLFAAAMLAMNATAQTVVFSEDFEGEEINWTVVDLDGDGYNWGLGMWESDENPSYCIFSNSYDNNYGALTPDNWIISPEITLGTGSKLTFEVKGQDPSWCAEHYGIFVTENVGATTLDVADWTQVYEGTSGADWEVIEADLSAFDGKTIQFAVRHYDITDMFIIKMDNFEVTSNEVSALSNVRVDNEQSNVWYDLQGRKYYEMPQTAGIYINNGKKYIVK